MVDATIKQSAVALPIVVEHKDSTHPFSASELTHWHDAIEVVSVTHGQLCCQANHRIFTLGKGDLCFINCQQLHRLAGSVTCEEEGRGLTLVMYADKLVSDPVLFNAYVYPVLQDPSFRHVVLPGYHMSTVHIREAIDEIDRLICDQPRAFELEVVSLCLRILRELYCALEERGAGVDPISADVELVKHMISFIRQHYSENIQLKDIAHGGSVSKSTCARLFKRYTGHSPVSYLIDYRLECAATLLRTTSDSVASIAQACGFAQQSYFSRVFQRAYGITPRAYRNNGGTLADTLMAQSISV